MEMYETIEEYWRRQRREQKQITVTSIVVLLGITFCYVVAANNAAAFGGIWDLVYHYVQIWVFGSVIWAVFVVGLSLLGDSNSVFQIPYELVFYLGHRVSYPQQPSNIYKILYTTAAFLMVVPVVLLSPVLAIGWWLFHSRKEASHV